MGEVVIARAGVTGIAGQINSDGSPGMLGECFQTLDVTRVRKVLGDLHERVTVGKGRIEIRRRGCDDVCVIISKAELEALEHALEILSESADYKAMCQVVTDLATAVSDSPAEAQA